ncbi:MAG TPA: RDD family protein [Terriglobales bacterium]|nr:RDD family protein [Terriglobales bacterium]
MPAIPSLAQDSSAIVQDAGSPAAPSGVSTSDQSDAWRGELAARLDRYRARRKMRPPRYPSLRLQFDAFDPSALAQSSGQLSPMSDFQPASNQALALDGTRQEAAAPPDGCEIPGALPHSASQPASSSGTHAGAKIIEFPRSAWAPPPPPLDQLAEPVSGRPRILEAPETVPPAPALGGITIEAVERQEIERRPGIDLPLQSAPLPRRLLAGAIDGLIVAAASALFGFIFWKVAAVRPPLVQLVGLAIGVPCLLWAGYQYLLIVYAARTPGLRLAGLELARFDGSAASRSLRRWRVLASYLSAASLGMGYGWVFLDEDLLCWHDRITHTYLSPKPPATSPASGA